jgi:hypothetical protein
VYSFLQLLYRCQLRSTVNVNEPLLVEPGYCQSFDQQLQLVARETYYRVRWPYSFYG